MAQTNVFTGANGTLTLAFEDTPEGQAARSIIELYEVTTVGRVTNVEVCIQTDLEEFHEIGRRHATSLHPGNIHISGKVGRAYINGALLWLLQGAGGAPTQIAEPYVQPVFNMRLALNDPAVPGNTSALELRGVKFQNWSFVMPEDDFVMENLSFKALSIGILDTEAPPDGGDGVAQVPADIAGGTPA